MNPREYQPGVNWFIHASNLRRTTLAFVYTATGITFGILKDELFKTPVSKIVTFFAIINLLLVLAGIVQEIQLKGYQKRISEYLIRLEESDGLFYNSKASSKFAETFFLMLIVYLLILGVWIYILL